MNETTPTGTGLEAGNARITRGVSLDVQYEIGRGEIYREKEKEKSHLPLAGC